MTASALCVGDVVEVSPGVWRTVATVSMDTRLNGRLLVVSVTWADDEEHAAPGRYPGTDVLTVMTPGTPGNDETEAKK